MMRSGGKRIEEQKDGVGFYGEDHASSWTPRLSG